MKVLQCFLISFLLPQLSKTRYLSPGILLAMPFISDSTNTECFHVPALSLAPTNPLSLLTIP